MKRTRSRQGWAENLNPMKNIFLLLVLLAGLGLMMVGRASAQTFTTLHFFDAGLGTTNGDGYNPQAGLTISGDTLYGTAYSGGSSGNGTIFAINSDATGFTNLHSFMATYTDSSGVLTNSDGANPVAGLILSGNKLYGTAQYGGISGNGTVFAVNTDGTAFTNLYSFTPITQASRYTSTNGDGANPQTGLILSGSTLYGTTSSGGAYDDGTLFKINTNGTGFTNLYSFNYNTDGGNNPNGLILVSNMLFGTLQNGGSIGYGTMFRINTDGNGFTNLHNFIYTAGARPQGTLVLSGDTLYGVTKEGGPVGFGIGTVFKINIDGSGFTNFYYFKSDDADEPVTGLVLSGNTLYGTGSQGGRNNVGAIFSIKTDGTGYTNLYSVNYNNGNGYGLNGLIFSGNKLYGTMQNGGLGLNDVGTIFALSLPPPNPIPLNIQSIANAVILNWTNSTFVLQSAPAVIGTYTNILGATSPYTNAITDLQKFFRLNAN